MKRMLLLLVAALALGGVLSAATITNPCTGAAVSGGQNATVTLVCTGLNGLIAGNVVIDSITATFAGDYTASGSPFPAAQFSWSVVGTSFLNGTSGPSTTRPQVTTVSPLAADLQLAFSQGGFNNTLFQVTGAGTGAPGVSGYNFSASFDFTYHDTTVPEPATFAFMGGGLLALGMIARRKA